VVVGRGTITQRRTSVVDPAAEVSVARSMRVLSDVFVAFNGGVPVVVYIRVDILMACHSSTRVPVDDTYAALVGKAVYIFAYYEWAVIYVIDSLRSGFVGQYSRGGSMTSGNVRQTLQETIDNPQTSFSKVSRSELQTCCDEFGALVVKRNALIHAHPITDSDGAQILAYQTTVTKPLPDMKWPKTEVELIIQEFDKAACNAGILLDRLR
jgi:hypothetical protein